MAGSLILTVSVTPAMASVPATTSAPPTGPHSAYAAPVTRPHSADPGSARPSTGPTASPARKAPAASGLEVSIDQLEPATLSPGTRLQIQGVVSNVGGRTWRDAQVYLDVGRYPATSAADLEPFADPGVVFSTRIIDYGRFDEIGSVPAGTRKSFSITVPYDELPIIGTAGVYELGVSVIAGIGENRDQEPEAQAETLVPLLPDGAGDTQPAGLVTVLPLTAPVSRDPRGVFRTDRLAAEIGFNGRLRNVLDFALQAPSNSLQIALDPALYDAARAMAEGYTVQRKEDDEPIDGGGQDSAAEWLTDLEAVMVRQHVVLTPWAVPQASVLATNRMGTAIDAGIAAATDYREEMPKVVDVLGVDRDALTNRRALTAMRSAGSALQLVSEASLPGLETMEQRGVAPPAVQLATRNGPLTAIVARDDIAGQPVRRATSALAVRQLLMAEGTVQSLSGRTTPVVLALPFDWDPGPATVGIDLEAGLSAPTLRFLPLSEAVQPDAPAYVGDVDVPADTPLLEDEQLDRIRKVRRHGRSYRDILVDSAEVEVPLTRQYALSASSAWATQPVLGRIVTTHEIRHLRDQLDQVTVATPAFVALSSGSGPFPVTVANNLEDPIRVRLLVIPRNPALKIDAIDELRLEPGQQRDVQVRAHAESSGLTAVRVRLATPENQRFGPVTEIDVRATQIGLAIWIVMGVGIVILVGAVIIRIIRRLRTPGAFSPREEPRHP